MLKHLDCQILVAMEMVIREFNQLCKEDFFWKNLLMRDFGSQCKSNWFLIKDFTLTHNFQCDSVKVPIGIEDCKLEV